MSAQADINNTRADAWGTLELSGSSWLGGSGVDVYSNGSTTDFRDCNGNVVSTYSAACKDSVNGQITGAKYQCVELVNRLYLTKDWISSTWTGNGNQMYANAPIGLSKEPNGSITYLNPGDVITLDDGGVGHAAVINSVSGSTVQIVNQNTTAVYSSSTFSNGTLSSPWGSPWTVQGVIHAPTGGGTTPAKVAKTDLDNNGKSDLILTTSQPGGGSAANVLLNTSGFGSPSAWWQDPSVGWSGITPLVGDLNNDGKSDYMFMANDNNTGVKFYVALSSGSGFSTPGLWVNLPGWSYSAIKPTLGDLNADGRDDLVLTTIPVGGGTAAYVLLNSSSGFGSPAAWWQDSSVGWSGITPMVGDLTGDGRVDYTFLANDNNTGVKFYVAATNAQGNGFGAPALWRNLPGWGYSGIKPSLGDVDKNKKADLVLTTNQPGGGSAAYVLLNTTVLNDPSAWWQDSSVGWSGIMPFVGDATGDGKADYLFVANNNNIGVRVYVAASTGTTFSVPGLWRDLVGWGFGGIKASFS